MLECYFIVAAKVLLQEDVRLLGSKCERTSENNRKSRGRSGVPWNEATVLNLFILLVQYLNNSTSCLSAAKLCVCVRASTHQERAESSSVGMFLVLFTVRSSLPPSGDTVFLR